MNALGATGDAAAGGRAVCLLPFALCLAALVLTSACGPRRLSLPTDSGAPFPNYSDVHSRLTAPCRSARTMIAELNLRGRAGAQRLRGRLVAGFARPSSIRLEGVAPFGQPAFILASRGESAVLLLPRDGRVVRDASAGAILGALTGVAFDPADLHAILTGCVVPSPQASDARIHANGWASMRLEGGATIYLERRGDWQLRAARREGWEIEYVAWQGAFPESVRLRSTGAGVNVDLTAVLSQIEVNVDIGPDAFTVIVPPGTAPLSLDELRDAGPLGEPE